MDAEIAESAARLRVACKLKAASAIGADALVRYDRDLSGLHDQSSNQTRQ